MEWSLVINWLFDIFQRIGEFGSWLFTRYRFLDVVDAFVTTFGGWILPDSKVNTIIQTLNNFFTQDTGIMGHIGNLSFTPIGLISVSGLIVIVILHAIDLIIAWW